MLFSGCATIVNGTTQKVAFTSEPPGATVTVDGVPIGNTPTSIDLKRDSVHSVTFEKDGYVASEHTVIQGASWWFAGNILLGGIIGMMVDSSTGAMYNLTPDSVSPVLIAAAKPDAPSPVPVAAIQPASPSAATPASAASDAAVASDVKPAGTQPQLPASGI
jgi:hypothetical protein